MKILKHRNLLGCLFAVILAMPLFQIGVRCAYTIFNKNAFESYSDTSIETISALNTGASLTNGQSYIIEYDNTLSASSFQVNFSYSSFDFDTLLRAHVDAVSLYSNGNIYGYYWNGTTYVNNSSISGYWGDELLSFQFIQSSPTPQNYTGNGYCKISLITLQTSKLDNAFEYSINKITDNNLGNLQFFTWFADLFIDLTKPQNALYVNFINWYFNYALLVSVVYILFLVLMWFIQFVRKLLEKGMDFGQRGY